MKIIFLVCIALFFLISPVYGQALSDAVGLVNRLDVEAGGHTFEIETVSNFDISDFEFDNDRKKLTLHIISGLENNLGELLIPQDLLGGNLTFYLNDQEYLPLIINNKKISFVTLNFTGSGDNTLEIYETTYLSGLVDRDTIDKDIQKTIQKRDTFDNSFNWIILAGILVIITAFVVMKIKKRKPSQNISK